MENIIDNMRAYDVSLTALEGIMKITEKEYDETDLLMDLPRIDLNEQRTALSRYHLIKDIVELAEDRLLFLGALLTEIEGVVLEHEVKYDSLYKLAFINRRMGNRLRKLMPAGPDLWESVDILLVEFTEVLLEINEHGGRVLLSKTRAGERLILES